MSAKGECGWPRGDDESGKYNQTRGSHDGDDEDGDDDDDDDDDEDGDDDDDDDPWCISTFGKDL
jgi:hypothetical protein